MANYNSLASELRQALGYDQVITDELLCEVLAVDASLYALTPKIIVKARHADEISTILEACHKHQTPVTFRAAGTSLSGQAVTDSVLLMMDDGWTHVRVLDDGARVYSQPGVIGAHVNRALQPYQRKIGPDPASIDSCMVGGIAANNSSGMCCGTAQNSYQTMADLQFILADGTQVNTADLVSVEQFRLSHKSLLDSLAALSEKTKADSELAQLIRHKYRLKNTNGFSLNALIDYDDPLDVLTHLMIGSEGCLGFISGITYETVPDYELKSTALFLFPRLESACQWVVDNSDLDTSAIELMDDRALASVPQPLADQISTNRYEVGLLLECQAENDQTLAEKIAAVNTRINQSDCSQSIPFTTDNTQRKELWDIRKGIIPTIASQRRPNTSVIIEDIAFPVADLASGINELTAIFHKHHYLDISIVGHAKDGNLHFVVCHDFSHEKERTQFAHLMDDMAQLVIAYGGSLKGEHGTGRNMAPFVEQEWGTKAYQLMHAIKELLDPAGLLNPGVVLNDDKQVHVKALKALPITHPVIDQCMECGYCESVCPTTLLSLTPRQRIAMARQRERLASLADTPEHQKQRAHNARLFDRLAVDSCATTSMCRSKCPVGIDTGDYILQQKQLTPSLMARVMTYTAPLHGVGLWLTRLVIKTRHWLVQRGLSLQSKWPDAPKSATTETCQSDHKAVFFSTCVGKTFSSNQSEDDARELKDVLISLMNKANITMIDGSSLNPCCGLPYKSQGLFDIAETKGASLVAHLQKLSENGRYPVVFDASPCVEQILPLLPKHIRTYDACGFVDHFVKPQLTITPKSETIALHVPCSSQKMGLSDTMISLAQACVDEVIVPNDIECCGFAGSKGFSQPEINAHALRKLKPQLPRRVTRGFSNSASCEIGLSRNSGIPYQSLLYLLDEVSHSPET